MKFDLINETDFSLKEDLEDKLNHALEVVMKVENLQVDGEVSLLFVDDAHIKDLNRQFRNQDNVTDVLSFPQYESIITNGIDEAYLYLGDVVISIERALDQSKAFNHSLEREIIYLTVHSLLHLLGYDHLEVSDKLSMRQQEKAILKELKVFK